MKENDEKQPLDVALPAEEPSLEEVPVVQPAAPDEGEEPTQTEPQAGDDTVPEEMIDALADGFLLLRQEVPEVDSVADVPEAVFEMAATERLPLLDAFLRYRWREQRAILEERARQRRTGEQAAGSLYTGSGRRHLEADAFARAFEQALH